MKRALMAIALVLFVAGLGQPAEAKKTIKEQICGAVENTVAKAQGSLEFSKWRRRDQTVGQLYEAKKEEERVGYFIGKACTAGASAAACAASSFVLPPSISPAVIGLASTMAGRAANQLGEALHRMGKARFQTISDTFEANNPQHQVPYRVLKGFGAEIKARIADPGTDAKTTASLREQLGRVEAKLSTMPKPAKPFKQP